MNHHVLAAAAAALLVSTVAAQTVTVSYDDVPYRLDSGYLANEGDAPRVLFEGTVEAAPDTPWMQLHFQNSNLPAGTRLELTSILDGAVQRFDAGSLRDYNDESAYFNGHEVRVRLIAAPHSRGNRVCVFEIRQGGTVAGEDTICGNTDDRTLSNDPRAGRGWTNGCSMWLASARLVLSAGHCGAPAQVHFNVPLSTASGQLVMPPPQDQYPLDQTTAVVTYQGLGNDFTVVVARRNSNTGLYPGQAQGAWFDLGTPPTQAETPIRITGYGTTSAPVPPQWNQAQKTHLGPLVRTSSTTLYYRTDTTGGNSGSVIIDETTGEAVGIHTNGGCTVGGGSNSGTRIDRPALVAAMNALLGGYPAGIWSSIGNGCTGTAGQATLAATGFPDLGATMTLQVGGVAGGQPGVLWFGSSSTTWLGMALPLDLSTAGFTGCSLYCSPDAEVPLGTGTGTPTHTFTIPVNLSLLGAVFFNQYAAMDAGANPAGVVMSNGSKSTIGR